MENTNKYKAAYEREVKARELAETLLENKTRELYDNVIHLEGVVEKLNSTQAQLIQSEKMSSLGQLTAGIAHEINNPIGFSYSNLTCLKDYLIDLFELDNLINNSNIEQLNSDEKSALLAKYKRIHEAMNINHLKEDIPILISDTLEGLNRVKKIVSNLKKISYKSNEQLDSCNINECINDCLKVVKAEFKYSMEVTTEFSDCPNILGQSSDLNQVFINLFINASHACETGGKLFIKTIHHKDNVVIIIKDNGSGIPKDCVGKIFDPFFTTKDIGEGTGLGLSISHGIIEKHSGTIEVETEENQGTSFIITLPTEISLK
jgi:C4-dicarboxylate-specific signal transduction histidine kinase